MFRLSTTRSRVIAGLVGLLVLVLVGMVGAGVASAEPDFSENPAFSVLDLEYLELLEPRPDSIDAAEVAVDLGRGICDTLSSGDSSMSGMINFMAARSGQPYASVKNKVESAAVVYCPVEFVR